QDHLSRPQAAHSAGRAHSRRRLRRGRPAVRRAGARRMSERKLIITGDDFGMSLEVNEAVEEAHRRGVLTSASLVVAGDAAADAIARAKRMPDLGVGLHVALLHAPAALSREELPDLIEPNAPGFGKKIAKVGSKIALFPSVRRQAMAEM